MKIKDKETPSLVSTNIWIFKLKIFSGRPDPSCGLSILSRNLEI